MKVSDMEVTLLGHYGDDLNVLNAARVSFNKVTDYMTDKDTKLIKYLADHKHHSPFNHSFLSFRIKAPIFVARQLQKHRFMPWNEVSRRYVNNEPEFYFPDYWRKKAENMKQGSSDERCNVAYDRDDLVQMSVDDWATMHVSDSLIHYKQLLRCGVCPEQARIVLPQNTMTEWVWSGTLGAFLDMLVLRLDNHSQLETRQVAKKIAVKVKELFPVSYNAYLGEM